MMMRSAPVSRQNVVASRAIQQPLRPMVAVKASKSERDAPKWQPLAMGVLASFMLGTQPASAAFWDSWTGPKEQVQISGAPQITGSPDKQNGQNDITRESRKAAGNNFNVVNPNPPASVKTGNIPVTTQGSAFVEDKSGAVGGAISDAKASVSNAADKVKGGISNVLGDAKSSVSNTGGDVKGSISNAADKAKGGISSALDNTKFSVNSSGSDAKNSIGGALKDAKASVTNTGSDAKGSIMDAADNAKAALSNAVSSGKAKAGDNLPGGGNPVEQAAAGANAVQKTVSDNVKTIRDDSAVNAEITVDQANRKVDQLFTGK